MGWCWPSTRSLRRSRRSQRHFRCWQANSEGKQVLTEPQASHSSLDSARRRRARWLQLAFCLLCAAVSVLRAGVLLSWHRAHAGGKERTSHGMVMLSGDATGRCCCPRHALASPGYLVACVGAGELTLTLTSCLAVRCSLDSHWAGPTRRAAAVWATVGCWTQVVVWAGCAMLLLLLLCTASLLCPAAMCRTAGSESWGEAGL